MYVGHHGFARDTARVEHLSMWNQLSTPLLTNPALHSAAYAQSYSEMALTIDFQHQSEAFVEEKGKGHVLGALAVNSYLRMNPRSAVWGSASYTTGKQKSICWNSTSDYELLAPYVMADTLAEIPTESDIPSLVVMAPSWGESCWEARWPFVLSTSIVTVIHVCEASLQNCCCEVALVSWLGIIVGAYWRKALSTSKPTA